MFDSEAYRKNLLKSIEERYSLREVDPASVGQSDMGMGQTPPADPNAPANPAAPTGVQQPAVPGHPKDPEISMEVLKGTVKWALGEKDSGKSTEEVLNQVGAMKKPGLIDFIHSYLQGSGQAAPAAPGAPGTGEPGTDDLSGLTSPEPAPAPAAPAPDESQPPTDNPL